MNKTLAMFLATTLLWSTGAVAEDEVPTSKKQADAEWSQDGLQKTKVKGLDLAYVRPGASLAGYQRVRLAPVSVAFSRNFGRNTTLGDPRRVDAEDMERIKTRLSALVQDVVTEELGKAGYTVTAETAADVLAVDLSIVNLYLNAPDIASAGRADVYTTSVGEMTLVAELADSSSGETLVRFYDRHRDFESPTLQLTTRVDNTAEARRAAQAWAKVLVRGLDDAKAIGAGG